MTASAPIPAGWSNTRFWLAAAVIFAGQVGWVFLLGERFQSKPVRPPERAAVRMLATPLDEEKWSNYAFAVDPTVLPISGSHGFADLAWHQLPVNEYSTPLPKPAPLFLPFTPLPPEPVIQPDTHPLWLLPTESAGPMSEPALTAGGREASILRIAGALARRQIAPPESLPGWTTNYLVTNTVIRFAVNRAGQVFTEALLEGSGLDEADQVALARVREFRFRPASIMDPPETWDTAIFYWRTVPPSTDSSK